MRVSNEMWFRARRAAIGMWVFKATSPPCNPVHEAVTQIRYKAKMNIPIQIGDKVLYPKNVILIRNRDRLIESVYRGERQEVVAKNIPCKTLEDAAELQQALAEGWEFFCAIMPDGYPRFWLKDRKWLQAAEKIADSIDKESLLRLPSSPVKQ